MSAIDIRRAPARPAPLAAQPACPLLGNLPAIRRDPLAFFVLMEAGDVDYGEFGDHGGVYAGVRVGG